VLEAEGVRRTSVIEWERCQGFPDNYTQIPWRGKPVGECPDGARYKAIGNSKAIAVVNWIGGRIVKFVELSVSRSHL
jgi:DNA (cytosine-5)-methyltransferase 1